MLDLHTACGTKAELILFDKLSTMQWQRYPIIFEGLKQQTISLQICDQHQKYKRRKSLRPFKSLRDETMIGTRQLTPNFLAEITAHKF
jgi:hypothetical protein